MFDSIEKEDVKGHMYIIESRKSDIVDDEYINIVKKQLRFINEYTYQYVSKSNYKKYKQAELFFNSEYNLFFIYAESLHVNSDCELSIAITTAGFSNLVEEDFINKFSNKSVTINTEKNLLAVRMYIYNFLGSGVSISDLR